MTFYQQSKTARAAVIGTIIPWTGPIGTIPNGWIICDGQKLLARDFPLLAQAIGDTYNSGLSDFSGNFPGYSGSITIPDLNNRVLMDIEDSYFTNVALGGTGKTIDTDPDARALLSPLIGDNVDNGATTIFTDVFIDVVFTLNDRTGYSGKITGNTFTPGEGARTLYFGPRKLGHQHIPRHNHTGTYETISLASATTPGIGVVPYGDVIYTLYFQVTDKGPGSNTGDYWYFGWSSANTPYDPEGTTNQRPGVLLGREVWSPATQNASYSQRYWPTASDPHYQTGFGAGPAGRIVAKVLTEAPPVNLIPRFVLYSPIDTDFKDPYLDSGRQVQYGLNGDVITIPPGYRNFYNSGGPTRKTFMSHPAYNFTSDDPLDRIEPHTHDEFDVVYDGTALRARSSITTDVNIPATTVPDNVSNRNALQIDFNISQPGLTCLYIIRAY